MTTDDTSKPDEESAATDSSSTSDKKRVFMKASCARCGTEVACWSTKLSTDSNTANNKGSETNDLYPSQLESTYLGPEYAIIFPDLQKAKRFLTKSKILSLTGDENDVLGGKLKVSAGLVCPSCGFLLASSPTSTFINLKGRVALYRSSLKLSQVGMPDNSNDESKVTSSVALHNELPLVREREDLLSVIEASADTSPLGGRRIIKKKIGQFWCPYSVHAVHLLSDFYRTKKADSGPLPYTILVLDTFVSGGASPDALPGDFQDIVRNLSIPCFLVWYKGHRVVVKVVSQHFHCVDGAIVGLDLARYVDITLPRITNEAEDAIQAALSSLEEKQEITIKLTGHF